MVISHRPAPSKEEAQAVVDEVTLEQVIIYRHYPPHLMPAHIRTALCRTPPIV